MSVCNMKLINIVGNVDEFDRCIKKYIINSSIHLENVFTLLENVQGLFPYSSNNPFSGVMKKIEAVAAKFECNLEFDIINADDIEEEQASKYIDEVYGRLLEYDDEILIYDNRITEINELINQLEIIKSANVDVDRLFAMKFISVRFGKLPSDSYKKIEFMEDDFEFIFLPLSNNRDFVFGVYFVPHSKREKADSLMASLFFERIMISDEIHGLPSEAADKLKYELDKISQKKEKALKEKDEYIKAQKEIVAKLYSSVKYKYEFYNIRKNAAHTEESFYLAGWIPQSDVKGFEHEIEKDTAIVCVTEDPSEVKNAVPPTKLKISKIIKPFTTFVEMYGTPAYNEIDPTLFLTITYIVIFGIMFGDVGQGIVLSIFGFLLYKFKKSNLGAIAGFCGISGAFWGLMFGSCFGFENWFEPVLIAPMSGNTAMNTTLITAVVGGTILVLLVMIFNIINGIKQKDTIKVFFGENAVAGVVFYFSAVTAAVLLMLFNINILSPVYIVFLILLPIASIFFKEPLSRLCERKKAFGEEGVGGFMLESFFEVFEIMLSFITNTISFVRIGAFALVHAGMMSVVIMFYEQFGGTAGTVILILGNLLVMGMEALIVGIQVLRLEFYELFGRFYSGSGKEYNPVNKIFKR